MLTDPDSSIDSRPTDARRPDPHAKRNAMASSSRTIEFLLSNGEHVQAIELAPYLLARLPDGRSIDDYLRALPGYVWIRSQRQIAGTPAERADARKLARMQEEDVLAAEIQDCRDRAAMARMDEAQFREDLAELREDEPQPDTSVEDAFWADIATGCR